MSLSFRGLLIAFPIVMLIVGGMAFFIYRSAIADFQSDAVAENLREKLGLVEETEKRALSIIERSLESGTSTELEEVFLRSEDGAFHSRPDLWSGTDLAGPMRLLGFGGFIGPPEPTGDRRAATMAAFDTIKAMANGKKSKAFISSLRRTCSSSMPPRARIECHSHSSSGLARSWRRHPHSGRAADGDDCRRGAPSGRAIERQCPF